MMLLLIPLISMVFLKDDCHFKKVLIPMNQRNESTLPKVGYNAYGYPTRPNDPSLSMKYCGITKEKGRSERIKWCCPKVHMKDGKWVCECAILAVPPKKDEPLTLMRT